jgi:hypothetical protein
MRKELFVLSDSSIEILPSHKCNYCGNILLDANQFENGCNYCKIHLDSCCKIDCPQKCDSKIIEWVETSKDQNNNFEKLEKIDLLKNENLQQNLKIENQSKEIVNLKNENIQ